MPVGIHPVSQNRYQVNCFKLKLTPDYGPGSFFIAKNAQRCGFSGCENIFKILIKKA
jgi:hypothetical protein